MKNNLLVFMAQAFLLCCQSPSIPTEKQEGNPFKGVANTPYSKIHRSVQKSPAAKTSNYLDGRSIRIKDQFPLIAPVKDIEGLLGRPDSVVQVDFDEMCSSDFRSENSMIAYYGNGSMDFEQFGDSLDFQSVDFSKDKEIFLQSGDLKLHHATTLTEINARFPNARIEYTQAGDTIDTVILPPSKEPADGYWLLMFRDGKLIKIDDWFPC